MIQAGQGRFGSPFGRRRRPVRDARRISGTSLGALIGLTLGLLLLRVIIPQTQEAGRLEGQVSFVGGAVADWMKLEETVVYLEGDDLPGDVSLLDSAVAEPVLRQKNQRYVPHVVVMMAGTELRITNGDTILHNIHTRSKGRRKNRPFNEGQEPGEVLTPTFPAPDSILVLCDIHSQMQAHLFVLPHPFFTMADESGRFEIEGVPPGSYRLTAWNEHFGFRGLDIEIRSGETTTASIDFERGGG